MSGSPNKEVYFSFTFVYNSIIAEQSKKHFLTQLCIVFPHSYFLFPQTWKTLFHSALFDFKLSYFRRADFIIKVSLKITALL